MAPFEYRMKWYSEDEATARRMAAEVGVSASGKGAREQQ